jgi:hypothetical protein
MAYSNLFRRVALVEGHGNCGKTVGEAPGPKVKPKNRGVGGDRTTMAYSPSCATLHLYWDRRGVDLPKDRGNIQQNY